MQKIWPGLSEIPFKGYIWASLAVNIAVIILTLLMLKKLPPEVPLFYGLAEGEEQLAPQLVLVIPSLVALAILIINILVSRFIKEDLPKKALVLAGIAAGFFAAITTIKILFLVGSF